MGLGYQDWFKCIGLKKWNTVNLKPFNMPKTPNPIPKTLET